MIVVREVQDSDLGGLEHLSTMAAEKHPGFLNVPSDTASWKERIRHSQESFEGKISGPESKYIFVAEDLADHTILGVSMISGQHGTRESPHFYFQVANEQKFSETINTGFIHGTLTLHTDTDGPSEIGGLIVDPKVRNLSEQRIGRQISFVRFLYAGLFRDRFKERIHAELLPPLTKKGKSAIWEAIGRRFTNMDYWEADYLSSKNKEFILSLFPAEKIYVTFLTAEARNSIGKVSKDTEPVMHMLKKIGFKYENQVDPFDGGPHLQANFSDLIPIQKLAQLTYAGDLVEPALDQDLPAHHAEGLLTAMTPEKRRPFKAISGIAKVDLEAKKVHFSAQKAARLKLAPGDAVAFMPYY